MIVELRRLWNDDQGQDLAEYGLLIALIAVAVFIGMTTYSSQMNNWFSGLLGRITTGSAN